jgi:acetyl esterase/lipase
VAHVYRRHDPTTRRPGILFVHGGGWEGGHPFAHIRRAALLAGDGFVTATIAYRHAPAARWPAQLDDVRSAIGWLRARADELGLDPQRLVLAGDSAGAHLAAMAALTAEPGAGLTALVLWYPIVDLARVPQLQREVRALLGSSAPAAMAAASPLMHVTDAAPPTLTMAGEDDEVVPIEATLEFHRALDARGVKNDLVLYPDEGHAFDFAPASWERSFEHCRDFLAGVPGLAETGRQA